MSHFRRRTAELEAVQYRPTAEDPLAFSDEPEWLTTALEVHRITLHPKPVGALDLPHLTLQAHGHPVLVAPGDWIIQDSEGKLRHRSDLAFTADYEPFPEPEAATEPATTAAPAAGGAAS